MMERRKGKHQSTHMAYGIDQDRCFCRVTQISGPSRFVIGMGENDGCICRLVSYWRSRTGHGAKTKYICMMTSWNGNILRVSGPLCGGIHRWPVNSPNKGQWRKALLFSSTCALNERFSKQPWGWCFETSSRSLWRNFNVIYSRNLFLYIKLCLLINLL